ncbi:MAG: hypothetical protein Q8L09_00120 [Candidatus Moranbacteria bacterium]|nr:hypothetical protein [Candidatus Moranbacteria bacterium]
MSNFGRSAVYGGIYAKDQNENTCEKCDIKINCRFRKISSLFEKSLEIAINCWGKTKELSNTSKNKLKGHIWEKQDLYLPVLIAAVMLALVFLSKTAFSKTPDITNNLPVEDNYRMKLIGTNINPGKTKICSADNPEYQKYLENNKGGESDDNGLKEDVAAIVKNTPMAAMAEAISQKSRPVAAFIVGIAMKESKFGVYSPKLAGRDCFNYWGFKGGGKTTSGGYSCFSSPDEAVNAVGNKIEKMVAKGVRSPAQAISWKCGSSCAGHGQANVQKWISDVGINFYKINS